MNKTAIKNFAVWARRKLIADITYKAGMLGITESGIAQPLKQSTKDLQFFDIGTKDYTEISGDEIQQRNALIQAIRIKEKGTNYKTAFQNIVEEVAYTWFNRLIAVRFMEVNDYLPSRIRVLSSTNPNKLEPDFVTTPFETDMEFTPYEKDRILQLKEDNKLDELFRMLFIKQCNKLGEILPELFERISDYTELLLNISFTDKDGVIYHLTRDISEDDFNVEKEGQVEIIGWLYQYYNTEPKDEVFALLKKNVKITKERIPAATQLFTPDWIVRYMVENSLGRLWVEGHPNEDLKLNWKYYLEEAEQEPEVQAELAKIREGYAKINPEDIKFIDPCMGSGHILVYAFDVLMQIYTSYGYTQRDAAKCILKNNIYGIDIDTRAYQLAYFAVMMKARQYNRRIFSEGILPNLMAVKSPADHSASCLKRLGDLESLGRRLVADFKDAEEYGSILQLNYTKEELEALGKRLDQIDEMADYGNLIVQMESIECVNTIEPLIRQARIMSQKYDVVVTNPPYMSSAGMSAKLSAYVRDIYPHSKSDLFAVFIEKCLVMTKTNRVFALITQQSWMFLTSFENLRKALTRIDTINMAHLGARAFDEISGEVVQTTSFVICNRHISDYQSIYCRLLDGNSEAEKEALFCSGKDRYVIKQDSFQNIPGEPIAYWVSARFMSMFDNPSLGTMAYPKTGFTTGDNESYLRAWFEVCQRKVNVKWFPLNKGGSFRKWYGNNEYYVDWLNNGIHIKNSKGSTIRNPEFYFKEGVTWSKISSYKFAGRYSPAEHLFDAVGLTCFPKSPVSLEYILALFCSKISTEILNVLNPTLSFTTGAIANLPLCYRPEYEEKIKKLVHENIENAKADWDDFETSWDFNKHPLLRYANVSLKDAFEQWEQLCKDRFNSVKVNEEELNRLFLEIYGLQNELTPEVEEQDVTIRKANLQRDIKSLISYAVGCMFGRYSLDFSGCIYTGDKWDCMKYVSYSPDVDNCIPITDEEYFEDDIVGRFIEFIRVVYGEDTLDENLEFIANALGNGGKTPRDTIRQYFLKDFYKDHCQTYSVTGSGKRPIYWLFDSGKQNGFKALVYMHRWDADTVGNLRVEYLHKMQIVYEKEIENCQDVIDNSLNSREISAATKRKEKLIKQLKEIKEYDAKIAHIALSRIDIDLDDGVKVNYRKVQTGSDGRFCEILADSKDIMVKEDSPLWQSLISNR